MARRTTPLTNTQVSQAKGKDKEYNLADGEGLMLRVKPNSTKIWIFNYYRPYTKKRANLSFGTFPEVTLAEARTKRTRARELLAQDIDPKEDRDKKERINRVAHANTFKHIADQHHQVKKTNVSADHAKDIWRSLELHLFPKLGEVPIHKLEAPLVIDVLKPIAAK